MSMFILGLVALSRAMQTVVAAVADPLGCMPYEQQRIDIEREPLRLDIRVEP